MLNAETNSFYAKASGLTARLSMGAFMLSLVCGVSQAQAAYQDPNGNFSLRVAAGWQAQPQSGSPMVSFVNEGQQASLTFGVMTGPATQTPSVDNELKQVESQFPQQCPQAKTVGQGPIQLGGLPGKFVKVSCSDGKGGMEAMEIAVASGPGKMVILNSAAPAQNLASVEPAWRAMQASFRLSGGGGGGAAMRPAAEPAGQMGQMGGGGGGGNVFRDPQGRYSFTVPPGWNVNSSNGNTMVMSGDAYAMFFAGSGSSAGQVAQSVAQQYTQQYKQVQVLNQGDTQVNGHPAHGINLTGINPKGVRASVLVISIDAGSGHILTVMSAVPNTQAQETNGLVMNMVNSIQF